MHETVIQTYVAARRSDVAQWTPACRAIGWEFGLGLDHLPIEVSALMTQRDAVGVLFGPSRLATRPLEFGATASLIPAMRLGEHLASEA